VWDLKQPAALLVSTDSGLEYGYLLDLRERTLIFYEIGWGEAPKQIAAIPISIILERSGASFTDFLPSRFRQNDNEEN
jgi:hypothetical protein